MSEIPTAKNLIKFVKLRLDSFVVVILCFMITGWLNLYLNQDSSRWSLNGFFYFSGLCFLISVIFGLWLELTYLVVKPIGALLLRSGKLWVYSVPAISVFLLIVEPALQMTSIHFLYWQSLEGWQFILLALFVVALFLLLLVLPIFHGLNSAFLVVSILMSRVVFVPLQNIVFESLSVNLFILFIILNLILSLLLYSFFQTRRRIGLSPHYERFRPNLYWFFVFGVSIVLLLLLLLIWPNGFLHPLLDTLYISLGFSISLSIFGLLTILYFESFSRHWLRLPVGKLSLILLLLVFSTIIYIIRSYKPDYIFFSRNTSVGQVLELLTVLVDRDNDGNSWWPGQDPDDSNQGIRREAKGEYKNRSLDLTPIGFVQGVDQILVTFVIPGIIEENPIYLKNQDWANDLPYLAHRWLQPSNRPERSLRALLQGLTSLEEVHQLSRRSLFSFAADDGYRTICLGLDYGQPYFHSGHWTKLDSGCQVFEPLSLPQVEAEPQFESCIELALIEAERLIAKYQEPNNFVWLHIDTRQCKTNLDLSTRRQLVIDKIEQLRTFKAELPFLTNQNRRMLSLILETGFLPYFYAEERNKNDSALFNEVLSSHLFLMRWYFAGILSQPNSESFAATQVLRKAENEYQAAGSNDLNNWVFLQEEPNQHIGWFRDVVGLSTQPRLPATLLHYDPRRRRLVYSHGIWNTQIELTIKSKSE
ncbi:MAG: hypothetical protein H3C43_02120 [Leptonema sp. (in: Bacteria)]|nr:hypothetical protein [Leptonema sp. (in: bacteria)]